LSKIILENSNQTKFIFIAGLPRSGGAATLESLDSHPDILVWPFEFMYFNWFENIANGRKKVPNVELNKHIFNIFLNRFSYRLIETEKYSDKNTNEFIANDLDFGTFSFSNFIDLVQLEKEEEYSPKEYLSFIFKCLQKSNSQYKNKPVKYFLLYTTARGFNWTDEKLIRSSLILFTFRDVKGVYNSLKQKYSKKEFSLKLFFSIKYKKSMLYWLETFKQIDRLISKYVKADNFYVIPLKALHEDSEYSLKKVCEFLQIDVHPDIFNLTIVGEKVSGNANENNLNQGKIAKRTSKISYPMYSFEKKLFASIEYFNFMDSDNPVHYNIIEMFFNAIITSFIEIDREKVSKRAKISLFNNYIDRFHILLNLLKTLFIFRNEKRPLYVLNKKNELVKKTPLFWYNTFDNKN